MLGIRKPGEGDADARIHEVRGNKILGIHLNPVCKAQPERLRQEQARIATDAVGHRIHTPNPAVLRSDRILNTVEVVSSAIRRLFLEILQVGYELREGEVGVDPVVQQVVGAPESAIWSSDFKSFSALAKTIKSFELSINRIFLTIQSVCSNFRYLVHF